MLARSDIAILSITEPPKKVVETLIRKGFSVVTIAKINDLAERIASMANPIIVAYSAGSEQETTIQANKLISTPAIAHYPLVFVGIGISRHQRMLGSAFRFATTLDHPADPSKILELINELVEFAGQNPIELGKVAHAEVGPHTQSVEASSVPLAKVSSDKPAEEAPKPLLQPSPITQNADYHELLTSVFGTIADLTSRRVSFDGSTFVKNYDVEPQYERSCLPRNPVANREIGLFFEQAPAWTKEHVQRVAITTNKIVSALDIRSGFSEAAKIATSLYLSAAAADPRLCRIDYLSERGGASREKLATRIDASADRVAALDRSAGDIVRSISKIIAGAEGVNQEEQMLASTIVAVDLVGRLCHGTGFWSSTGAHTLIRRFRSGALTFLHPQIISCTVMMITEAANSEESVLLLPRIPSNYATLLSEIRGYKKLPVRDEEVALHITDLQPGMTVSQPVIAFDGTMILSEGVVLDHDLILRLWQMSAVKPLLTPLIILSENEHYAIVKDESGESRILVSNSSPG